MSETFPDGSEPKADWWTGVLATPNGKHIGGIYYPEFENYLLLEIKEGNLIREHNLTLDEYKTFENGREKALEEYEHKIDERRQEADFVEPTQDEWDLYMFEQEIKILNEK